ncbi:MAG: tRNA-dihydrouridine synthase family protein, partial [Deltaproteobacteria bacterium]|nr:tRNA-dihydrouridine synthase family protein [Deltaproteobacteria bacterium]
MYIGKVTIEPNLILAPMEGVTDLTFRRLIRQIGGCGLTCTEFVPGRGLRDHIPRVLEMVQFDEDEHPLSIQVYGRDPVAMAEGARMARDLGADIVDLNLGCPSRKVCAHSGGSALLREPALAKDIVCAMRTAVDGPFTVKMRAGWDPEHQNAPEIAHMCEEEGVDGVTVHWRTRTERFGGTRRLDVVAAVKDRLSIPVIANGDIIDASSALHTLEATNCDGLMIGRGAIRNPWVFREIEAALVGHAPPLVTATDRERVLLGYYREIRTTFRTEKGALGRMKKIARYFTEGVPNGR